MLKKSTLALIGSLLTLLLAVAACEVVQQTGRSQFIVISEPEELRLGEESYRETLSKARLSTRSDWQTQLRRVGQRIAAVANKPEYNWEFNVLQGKEVNAFALPGGEGSVLGRDHAAGTGRQRRRRSNGT